MSTELKRRIGALRMREWRARNPHKRVLSDGTELALHRQRLFERSCSRFIGRQFGELRVVAYAGQNRFRQNLWLCRCNCGELATPASGKLLQGVTRSCGCLGVRWARQMGMRKRPPRRQGQALRNFWNKRNAIRRKTNKVEILIRHRIWEALKSQNQRKSQKLTELLGTDISGFKAHLKSLFREGMSWENYGRAGWHVDHIMPCSSFDLSLVENQKRCFHFSNCQPLWAHDNIKKRDRIPC